MNAPLSPIKGYDVKNIYNTVHNVYHGDCCIPINKRGTKNPKKLPCGNPICEAGLAMHRDGKFSDNGRTRQKFCCVPHNQYCDISDTAFGRCLVCVSM